MATQTSNLGLTKPAGTDFVQVNDFNGNSDIVDRSIGKLSELRTNVKSSLVEAINEAMISGGTDSPYVNKTNGHWMQWNNTLLKFEDTGVVASGSMWYNGTNITGTSAAPSVFETGISLAHVGDLYLNTQSANVYWCAKEGNASTATWRYLCNIKGLTGNTGPIGPTGTTFTPSVNSQTGIISWSNDGGKPNPPSVNIKGPKGDPGVGLDIRGTYATLSDLQSAVTSPQQGWMYNVGAAAPYRVYMYDSSAGWVDQGQLQGPTGSPGKSAYLAAVEGGYVGNEETFNAQMAEMPTHITDTNNPHSVNKSQIGLGNVDNTSDLEKPISNAQRTVNQQILTELQDKQPLLTPGDNISISGSVIATKAFPCNPNLLDNWYFGNPVNQRGQTSYSGGGYCIDRWRMLGHSVSVQDGGIRVTCNSASSVNYALQQLQEYLEVGAQYTLSALILENTTTSGINLRQGDKAGDVLLGAGLFSWTFTAESSASTQGFGIQFNSRAADNGKYFVVKAIKLELGDTQTLAHQDANGSWVLNEIPNYGEQLRRCQRYCAPIISWTRVRMSYYNASNMYFMVPVPESMRATPSLSDPSGSLVVSGLGSGTDQTGFTFSVSNLLSAAVLIAANKTSHGLTDGQLVRRGGSGYSLTLLSADL